MKRLYYLSGKWRKKDIRYFNELGIWSVKEPGYDSFTVDTEALFQEIISHFSKSDSLFSRTKPENFIGIPASVSFSKAELYKAPHYGLLFTGEDYGMPQPHDSYNESAYSYDCPYCYTGRQQKAAIKMDEPHLKKGQVSFILTHWDVIFFSEEFYREHLASWGLKFKRVVNYKSGKLSDKFIQLDIPEAKSKLVSDGGEFGEKHRCDKCKTIQYGNQILDFFPGFEKPFDFSICKTQEEFLGGLRRIVISKDFCEFLLQHKINRYNSNHLVPVKPF